MALNLVYLTLNEFAVKFWTITREAYKAGDKYRYHFLIWWLWDRIQRGDITNDQVRVSFNSFFGTTMTLSEWNVFVQTKLIPIKDRFIAFITQEELTG